MIITILGYITVFGFLFPSILKYKHKGAMLAFLTMFLVAFVYSILLSLEINMEFLPFFFSNLIKKIGIKYPKL